MAQFNPVIPIYFKLRGSSTSDAVRKSLFVSVLPGSATTALGTAGSVLLADRLGSRISVSSASSSTSAAPGQPITFTLPAAVSSSTPAAIPGLDQILGAGTTATGQATAAGQPAPGQMATADALYFQKIEGANTVNFTKSPPEISGAAGMKIDFIGAFDAASYSWDFGTGAGHKSSTARNPTVKQYNTPGNYDVILTTVDAQGKESDTPVATLIVT